MPDLAFSHYHIGIKKCNLKSNTSVIYVIIVLVQSCWGLTIDNDLESISSLSGFQSHQAHTLSENLDIPSNALAAAMGNTFLDERVGREKAELFNRQHLKGDSSRIIAKNESVNNDKLSISPLDQDSEESSSQEDGQSSPRKRQVSGRSHTHSTLSKYRLQRYEEDDKALEKLQPIANCSDRIQDCANMPTKYLECFIDCHLSESVLKEDSLKFIYRLLKVYISYPPIICSTFGKIHEIAFTKVLESRQADASLHGYLSELGLSHGTPEISMYIKNSPEALFNNLVNYGIGPEFTLIKPVLTAAEKALNDQEQESSMFPAFHESPLCQKKIDPKWFVKMMDLNAEHPLTTDILLKGFFILTRALTQDLPYSTEGMFVSVMEALKLMVGVQCSIVSYAATGTNYKCLSPPPIDQILEFYSNQALANQIPYSWFVCGAHQVQVPDFMKEAEMEGRGDDGPETPSPDDFTLDKYPNPDEIDDRDEAAQQ